MHECPSYQCTDRPPILNPQYNIYQLLQPETRNVYKSSNDVYHNHTQPQIPRDSYIHTHTHTYILVSSKTFITFCMPCRACASRIREVFRPRLVAGWKELGGFEGYLLIRVLLDLELQSIYDGEDKGKGIRRWLMGECGRMGSRRHACLLPAGCGSNRRVDFAWPGAAATRRPSPCGRPPYDAPSTSPGYYCTIVIGFRV